MTVAGLSSLLPIPVTLPLAGAAIAPLAGRLSRRLPLVVSLVVLVGATVLLALDAPTVYGGQVLAHFLGHWLPIRGSALGDALAADPFGLTFALLASAVGAVILLFTLSSQSDLGRKELGNFSCLFLLLDGALIGSGLTADLVNLFVWFEVAALASYGLTAFFLERPPALEAAFKVLVLTTIAGFCVFVGAILLYSDRGALNFGQLQHALAAHHSAADAIALALLLVGFATKAGLVPFHGWLPDAHTAAPGPVSALFSGLMVNLGIIAVARLVFQVFGPDARGPALGLLMVLGVTSALGGALFALVQDDLKRLLSYDTISQMGVLAVGLASGRSAGLGGATYQMASHALFKTLLFLCAGAIVHVTGITDLSQMGGLARRMPGIAVAFTIGTVAIAGVPPLNGYAGVGMIHDALLDSGQPVIFALMLVAQAVTIAALGKACWQAFYRRRPQPYERDESLRPGMVTALAALAGGCLAFGSLPTFVLPDVIGPSVAGLLHPAVYARAVLASGGRLPRATLSFEYFAPKELGAVAATLAAAYPIGRLVLSRRARTPVTRVRSVMTGSVNDYAAYLTAGLVVTLLVIDLGR